MHSCDFLIFMIDKGYTSQFYVATILLNYFCQKDPALKNIFEMILLDYHNVVIEETLNQPIVK
jgi:hypothetical protein